MVIEAEKIMKNLKVKEVAIKALLSEGLGGPRTRELINRYSELVGQLPDGTDASVLEGYYVKLGEFETQNVKQSAQQQPPSAELVLCETRDESHLCYFCDFHVCTLLLCALACQSLHCSTLSTRHQHLARILALDFLCVGDGITFGLPFG